MSANDTTTVRLGHVLPTVLSLSARKDRLLTWIRSGDRSFMYALRGVASQVSIRSRWLWVLASLVIGAAGGVKCRSARCPPVGPGVTFTTDVAPIVYEHCAACHRPGQVAPFPLLTYEDMRAHGAMIAAATKSRLMPPWKPEPDFGDFEGDRRLSNEDIDTLQQWVAEGMPRGEMRDLPPVPHFPDRWYLGTPDLVVSLRQPFDVPEGPNDVYRCFVVPVDQPGDRYISAWELRPSAARVVHHAIIVEDSYGAAMRLQGASPSGYACFGSLGFPVPGYLGLWTSGALPKPWPAGVASRIRQGSGLVMQVHFHPDGKPEKEQFQIGLYFSKQPAQRTPFDQTIGTQVLNIPPGASSYGVNSYGYIAEDSELLGVIPHAHFLGKEVKATATLPDGTIKPLIWIKQWDFNWQEEYRYKSPVHLPQGTRIDVKWTYDNSAGNPRNPNHPPKLVTWGEDSTDEMCELHLELIAEGSEGTRDTRNGALPETSGALTNLIAWLAGQVARFKAHLSASTQSPAWLNTLREGALWERAGTQRLQGV